MKPWPPITRDDLRHAAGSAGFHTTFPLLVRRLIAETGKGVTDLDMPGGSGTATPGFDGIAKASGQSEFVPAGVSVWELSVGGGKKKADEDYDKRLSGPDGIPTSQVTYIQVILDVWTTAREWAMKRNQEGRWREVRAYNLDRIHRWLECAPATTAWLAEQLGKAMPGVQLADTWWADTWLPSTTTPLHTGIVLAGREQAADSFRQQLTSGKPVIALGGDLRREEARAFITASLKHAAVPESDALISRTLFVSDINSLVQLIKQPQPLVLFLVDPALATELPHQHRHQIVLLAPPGTPSDVYVPPVDGPTVESHLQAAGLPRVDAAHLGTLARRSLLALRRKLAVNPVLLLPSWASTPDVVRRRLLLIGGWSGDCQEDRRIVEQCVGRPYYEIQESALKLAAAPEIPFIAHVEEKWHVLSPEDAWTLLSPQLTRDDFEAFRAAVLEVLTERNPVLDLDESQRWKAGIYGVRRKFSFTLRNSLAQTLALLGGSGSAVCVSRTITGAQWASAVVGEIFAQADADETYGLWASLTDVLPLLAEAAPETFLQAMANGLSQEPSLHTKMFTDSGPNQLGFPTPSPHTTFLHALEILAWSPDYFDEVIEILGRLAALDPGGRWANRPIRSLSAILSSCVPNTTVDVNQRVRAIKRLHREQPYITRRLLLDLVPDGVGSAMLHEGPRFRDWKKELSLSRTDRIAVTDVIVDILLKDLDKDVDRYIAFIPKLHAISDSHRELFAKCLCSLSESLANDRQRMRIADALRDFIARHREYSERSWTLSEGQLRTLETALQMIQPRDPVWRNVWLFNSHLITLGDVSLRDNRTVYKDALKQRRIQAVEEVLINGGLSAVRSLAMVVKYPRLVGTALARLSTDFDSDLLTWLAQDQGQLTEAAFAYFSERFREQGTQLCDEFLSQTKDAVAQARILLATFDPPTAWLKLKNLASDVAQHYWQELSFAGLGPSFMHVLEAARSLTKVGRYAAALSLLLLYEEQSNSAEGAEIAARALESLLASGCEDPEIGLLNQHDFEQLFALLSQYSEALGKQRLVLLEWQFFPALGFKANAPTLQAALAEDPAFFAEMVGYVYRRGDHQGLGESGAELQRAMAKRAFEVLQTWRLCPGMQEDGTLDEARLFQWVIAARERLRENDLLEQGDILIGQVLAFAPPDRDGMFPPRAVRELLEEVRSGGIETGLRIGIYNRRGVVSRGVLEGGAQERVLARTYLEQAESAAEWPRSRKILKALADDYERYALWQDRRAELRHRGLNDD